MIRSRILRLLPLTLAGFLLAGCTTTTPSDPSSSSDPPADAPSSSRARGIDVSDNVGSVDWSAVKADSYSFAFVKATDGVSYPGVDYFYDNWPKMKAAGIIRGAYHYYESDDDPAAQANYFAETLDKAGGLQSGDLPPVLDFEEATSGNNVLIFLRTLMQKTGRTPIIYVDESFANSYLTDPVFATFPLWLAEYGVESPKVPAAWKNAGKSWSFWQTRPDGTVNGIPGGAGQTDLDQFNGSISDLKSFIRKN